MDEIVDKILVELNSTLALVTRNSSSDGQVIPLSPTVSFSQPNAVKLVKKLFKEDNEAVLGRLDQLAQDEIRTAPDHTIAIVHGLVQNMKEFMDGEQ
jgi:hypothetical protein